MATRKGLSFIIWLQNITYIFLGKVKNFQKNSLSFWSCGPKPQGGGGGEGEIRQS